MTMIDSPMTLSSRVRQLQPSATLAVTARVRQLKAEGHDIIGFGAGEPDFETPANIKQAAIDALLAGETHYMPVAGDPKARAAIAEKLKNENGIPCTTDDIVITVGAKHALYEVLQCLLDPAEDQEVILLTPAWVSYRPMVELAGGRVIEVPGAFENDYKIKPQQLEDAINSRTAAVIINSPSNPSGTMYRPDELRALASIIEGHDHITLISDEIYEKLIFGDIEHFSPGSLIPISHRVVTINGLSKAYAMTGWRIGYVCNPGTADNPDSLIKAISKLQGQMTSNITSFSYAAIIEALTSSDKEVEQMRRSFAERAKLTFELITAMPQVRCPVPTGAFYVFPDVSAHFGKRSPGGIEINSSLTFAEALLEDGGVAVVPGEDFGKCGAGHVRLSFACSTDKIKEGCRRIHEWLTKLT